MWKALKSSKSVSQHKTLTINGRTCGTTRCVPRPRIYSPSGCRPGSSWPWHTRWESARLHNAHAIFSRNLPLHSKRQNRGVYRHATWLIILHSITGEHYKSYFLKSADVRGFSNFQIFKRLAKHHPVSSTARWNSIAKLKKTVSSKCLCWFTHSSKTCW